MTWRPGSPWPPNPGASGTVTPGGAAPAAWGGYIRFWLLAEIQGGFPFTLGQAANDRLDAGNCLTDASTVTFGTPGVDTRGLPTTTGLWVDMSCDVVDVEISAGASSSAGVLSKVEAGTLTATLFDPTGKYDPANPTSPFALSGRSRLVPGVRVLAFAEVINGPDAATTTADQYPLFTGTADSWSEDWDKSPGERRAKMVASDFTKQLVKLDRDEQPATGNGQTVASRLSLIASYFGFPTPTQLPPYDTNTRLEQATTLAQSAWELLNRTITDELGLIWVGRDGHLYWVGRLIWTDTSSLGISLGCGDSPFWDIVTDATPESFDADLINTVTASRSGGTSQRASNTASVTRWGEHSIQRTDLGLYDDPGVADWAAYLVYLSANPRAGIERMTLAPAVVPAAIAGRAPESWRAWRSVLGQDIARTVARVRYANPNYDYTVDVRVRLLGYTHRITADEWKVEWRTTAANVASTAETFTLGPHAQDRLDAGFVLG